MAPDVPLLIPEVNPEHAALVKGQGTPGFVATNPNCSTVVLTMVLKPLHDALGLASVQVTTLQALSGAGHPGVPSLDALGNVLPHIPGEEDKLRSEPRRLLGELVDGAVEPASFGVSATCTRVPVREGHTVVARVTTRDPADADQAREILRRFRGPPQELDLPTAPERPLVVHDDEASPQPRRDWRLHGAMAVSVGRVREDPLGGLAFVACGSNTVRGAAGGSVLNAELMLARGLLPAP